MIPILLFLLLSLTPASPFSHDAGLVESGCSSDKDCYSPLMYCSNTGVCTCNQTVSNLVFKRKGSYSDIRPWCEANPCAPDKYIDFKECNLQNAECVPNPLVDGDHFCKCPEGTVGASFKRFLGHDAKCIDIQLSTFAEPCWRDSAGRKIRRLLTNITYSVCDRQKRLKCDDNNFNLCICQKDYKFDNSENQCVKEVGGYKNLCDSTKECHGEMVCRVGRCNCPPDCTRQYVIEDNICSCPDPSGTIGKILLSALGFSIVFIIVLACAYYRENKKRTSALINQEEFSLQTGPLYPNSSNNRQIPPDPHAASAPVLYPESALPTYSSQISDGLPTYNEATQTNLKT